MLGSLGRGEETSDSVIIFSSCPAPSNTFIIVLSFIVVHLLPSPLFCIASPFFRLSIWTEHALINAIAARALGIVTKFAFRFWAFGLRL